MPEPGHLRTAFLIWLVLTLVGGVLAWGLWRRVRGLRETLEPQPVVPVPWGGIEVYLVVSVFLVTPLLIHDGLVHSGFFTWLHGPEAGAPSAEAGTMLRRNLWVMLVRVPVFVAAVLLLTQLTKRTRPAHLGLTVHRLWDNVKLGLLAALVCTPAVNALHTGVAWVMSDLFGAPPEDHQLTQLATQGLTTAEWVALVASAVLAAPIVEELLFRGVIQRWLVPRPWGGELALGAAVAVALVTRLEKLRQTWTHGPVSAVLPELVPALFVLALFPIYVGLRRWLATPARRAIFGTAALFAAIHAPVWPTPIPLFVLGLVLGVLAHRTQSLTAPLVLHALFNAAACAVLLGGR